MSDLKSLIQSVRNAFIDLVNLETKLANDKSEGIHMLPYVFKKYENLLYAVMLDYSTHDSEGIIAENEEKTGLIRHVAIAFGALSTYMHEYQPNMVEENEFSQFIPTLKNFNIWVTWKDISQTKVTSNGKSGYLFNPQIYFGIGIYYHKDKVLMNFPESKKVFAEFKYPLIALLRYVDKKGTTNLNS